MIVWGEPATIRHDLGDPITAPRALRTVGEIKSLYSRRAMALLRSADSRGADRSPVLAKPLRILGV